MRYTKLWLATIAVLLCSITRVSGEIILTEEDGLLDGLSVFTSAGALQYEYTSPKFTVDEPTNTLTFTFLEGYTQTASLNDKNGYPFVSFSEFYLYDGEGNEIALDASNFSTNAQEPTQGPMSNICDKNRTTYFHSLWSAGASDYHSLVITLPEGMELQEFSFKYYTRSISHGIPKKFSVKTGNGEISKADMEEETDGIILSQANGPLGTLQGSTSGKGIRYYSYTSPVQTLDEATNTLLFTFLEGHTVSGSMNDKNGFPFVAFSEFCLYDGEGNEIPLEASNFTTNAQESTEGPISNICDKNSSTYFHSMWSAGASDYHNITITLPEGMKLKDFYFQYNTREVTSNWSFHGLPKKIRIQAGYETVVDGTCGDNLTWKLSKDGNLLISGVGAMRNYDYNYNKSPWYDYREVIKNVTMAEGITSIGDFAFFCCEGFTKVEIPEGVEQIGQRAFINCYGLQSISIPKTVSSIGEYAFAYCNNLTAIVVDEENPKYDSRNNCNAIIETSTNTIVRGTANTTRVSLENVKGIGDMAFSGCNALFSYSIPEGVASIGEFAFSQCYGLASVLIPQSVNTINEKAFFGCIALSEINSMAMTPPAIPGTETFNGVDLNNCVLGVPVGSKEAYQVADGWKGFCLITEKEELTPSSEIILTEEDGLLSGLSVFTSAGALQYEYTSPKFVVDEATNTLTFTFLEGYTRTASLNDKNGYPFVSFSEFYLYDGEGNEIALDASNFSTNAQEPTEGPIRNICDKNRTTFFHSLWSAGASDYHNLVITLPEGMELQEFSFKYHTRYDKQGIPKKISIKAGNGEISRAEVEEEADGIILSQANGPLGTLQGSTSGRAIRYYTYTSPLQTLDEATDALVFTFLEGYTVDGSLNDKNGFPFVAFSEFCLYDGEGNEIPLDANNFSTNAQEPTEGPIENICDKDSTTFFHTLWSAGASDYHNLIVTLPEGMTLKEFYFQYDTRAVTDNWSFHGLPKKISIKTDNDVLVDGTCGDNLTWTLTVGGDLTISGSGDMHDYNNDAPWYDYRTSIKKVTINEGVNTIGCSAFANCENLASANIPDGVARIGWDAFFNTNISSVYIPKSVQEIWNAAFADCDNLVTIIVDVENPVYDSRNGCNAIIETRGNRLISGCASTIIPDGVVSIAQAAFWGCDNLTSITFPESLEFIEPHAFAYCSGLTSISIPRRVESIDQQAFGYCYNLGTISVDSENVHYDSRDNCNAIIETKTNTIIRGTAQTVIPGSVKTIGDFAFSGCLPMKSFNIPEGVTSIGSYAFCQCNNLVSVNIPQSVAEIKDYTFAYCTNLLSVSLPVTLKVIGTYAFWTCSNMNNLVLPEGLERIDDCAFLHCYGLQSIEIPSSIEYIGEFAFQSCTGLTSLSIAEGIDSISQYAFSRCTSLTHVTIPNSVSYLGEGVFWQSSNLRSVTIGSGMKYIDKVAFKECNALSQINSLAVNPPQISDTQIFYGVNKATCKLNVPVGSKVAYQAADVWKDFSLIVEKEELTSIEQLNASSTLVWPTDIYDMHGRVVRKNAHSADGLPNGVYIINGRKVIIND